MLPYFLRHYTRFADVFIIDDHSTDNTRQIAQDAPRTTLLDYKYKSPFTEKDHSKAFIEAYKEHSKDADWVICVDCDEFIYTEDVLGSLVGKSGILKPEGYMMISEASPTGDGQIYDEIKTGIRMRQYDKPVIVQPHVELEFGDGRHSVVSDTPIMRADMKLLHYKYLGRDYYQKRSEEVYPRTDMPSDEIRKKRLQMGLKWYDDHIIIKQEVI